MRIAPLPVVVSFSLCLVLGVEARAQRSEWIVDPANGPGTSFTTVQAAADAAAPGDILRLRAGNCGPLSTAKPLVILGVPAAASVLGPIDVHSLPAGSEFVLRDASYPFASSAVPPVQLTGCTGRVVLQNVQPTFRFGVPFEVWFSMAVTDCADVDLVNCGVTKNRAVVAMRSSIRLLGCAFSVGVQEVSPTGGYSAVDAGQSDLWLVGTTCFGGPGNVLNGYGLRAVDGTIHLGGSSNGQSVVSNYGASPRGLSIVRTHVVRDPNFSFVSGIDNINGVVDVRPLPIVRATGSVGGTATATLSVTGSDVSILTFSAPTPPQQVPGLGELAVDPTFVFAVAFGVPGTTLATSFQVPNQIALIGAGLAAQGVASIQGQLTLSNRALLVLQ